MGTCTLAVESLAGCAPNSCATNASAYALFRYCWSVNVGVMGVGLAAVFCSILRSAMDPVACALFVDLRIAHLARMLTNTKPRTSLAPTVSGPTRSAPSEWPRWQLVCGRRLAACGRYCARGFSRSSRSNRDCWQFPCSSFHPRPSAIP